jgi:hypothetical protein
MEEDIIHTPLSGEDIVKKLPNCKFILYENMHKMHDITDLLPKSLILYELSDVGHFCCLFDNKEGINVFDSLGYFPDDELQHIDPSRKHKLYHDHAYLDQLLYNCGAKKLIYNEYRLQNHHTATCGDWCAIRLLFSDLTNEEFYDCFKRFKNKDEIVAKLYNNL